MKKITISDLDGFTDICECEKMLGELKAGCTINTGEAVSDPNNPPDNPYKDLPFPSDPIERKHGGHYGSALK
ncbi:MAG: hypothetical protein E7059_04685 [Treponema bryantii]|nr:hypothetical protein [Treponema bryantii]